MKHEEQFIHSLKFSDVARAISRDYFRLFCVNTDTDVFVEFIPHENDEELDVRRIGPDFKDVVKDFVESAFSQDLDTVRTAVTKQNIMKILSENDSFTLDYRIMMDGKPTYVRLKATRVKSEDSNHVLLAFRNTDAHMRRLAMYERTMQKSLTYAAVSEALAVDYICIYYVDMDSGEFVEYKSSEQYKELNFAPSGRDFFDSCRNDFAHIIYEEDRDVFQKAFEKANLQKVLSVDRMFLLTFRVLLHDKPTYIRMKVTKMIGDDGNHVVIGLSNVDASMQRIHEYEEMKEIANRDPLTGVKSKHAFSVAEEKIDREIEHGEYEPFAVAVCDVNGLKQINDTLGHKAGDQYIKDACMIVCRVFKHSPVFRIGGDEFVVLMKGDDYENREELMDEINRKVEKNKSSGDVVVSVGISEFVPEKDKTIEAVFQRADELMYKRKAQLKAMA